MSLTRRDFIRLFGLALASLAVSRCSRVRLYSNTPRDRLRKCWTQFDELAKNVQLDVKLKPWNHGENNKMAMNLLTEHRAALDELVASGDLNASAADVLHEGFSAAIYHIWRSNVPITCYEPMMVNYQPSSAAALVGQSAVLDEMAVSSDLDADTVATLQRAIENDLAFVVLTDEEEQALYEKLINAANADTPIPQFNEMHFESGPEVSEAAQFLVELFVDEKP